jgi:methylated-DNA-[protein]-cysteine S-methyltransferase
MMNLISTTLDTPIGRMLAVLERDRLCGLEFLDQPERCARMMSRLAVRFGGAREGSRDAAGGVPAALAAYFAGEVHALEPVPVVTCGTPFEERVWAALRTIPAGETRTYASLGPPGAARAVGAANGRNLISLVIPCHRAVATGGGLGGYGGGLERKRWLLAHEARHAGRGLAGVAAGRPAQASLELDDPSS